MTAQPRPRDVDPTRLVAALVAAGWTPAGGHAGQYTRLYWPGEAPPRGRFTIVPEDAAAGDFETLMNGTLLELADAAGLGRDAQTVLDVLAGAAPVDPEEPTDLDYAMWVVWLESGKWRWTTEKMTTPARETAVAAVLRYDRWLKRTADPSGPLLTRESLAWWD